MAKRLSDAELRAHLRRRAEAVAPPPAHRLVAALRDADVVPLTRQSVAGRVAGAAAATAIVAALAVLALSYPRPGPGGTATPQLADGPPSTIHALGTRAFEAALAGGDLDGHTLLISEALIEPQAGDGADEPECDEEGRCLIGTLGGTEPPIEILARHTPTVEGRATPRPDAGVADWPFWYLPRAPIEGTLAVSVDGGRRVELLGRGPAEEVVSLLGEVRPVDVSALAQDEVRVVPSWLTGLVGPISGAPPASGTFIAGLPQRYAGAPAWLAEEPVRLDPNGYLPPDGAIRVQNGAYEAYADTPTAVDGIAEPRAGVYVIAPRLEGAGCPAEPPCWQWNVIGRLTHIGDDGPARPIETRSPSTLSPAPSATESPAVTAAPFSPAITPPSTPPPTAPSGEHEEGLLIVTAQDPATMAIQRLEAMLGPEGCTGTVGHDREASHDEFGRWADAVEDGEGLTENGWGWLGDWRDAARAFGAFEAYLADPGPRLVPGVSSWTQGWILAVATGAPWLTLGGEDGLFAQPIPPGALIVADLTGFSVSGGRTLWIPAYAGQTVGTTSCIDGVIQEPSSAGPTAEVAVGDFTLNISAGRPTYAPDEPMDVEAALTYEPAGPVTLVASGSGLVIFTVEQLDGELRMGGGATADCSRYELNGREVIPFEKGAGFSEDDPNAEFYQQWVQEPQFTLPAGAWRITAYSEFYVEECGGGLFQMEASIFITIR